MGQDKFYRIALVVLSLLQIGLSAIYLNSLSRIDNWSAVYAEDSKGYILVAKYFMGSDPASQDTPLLRYRLFSPAIPFVASVLGRIIGLESAFLFINILLWNITALVFYELVKTLLKDLRAAFAGAAIFATSMPLLEWGLPIMVDTATCFFLSAIPLLYLKIKERGMYAILGLGVFIGFAILFKPNLMVLVLFVFFSALSEKRYAAALVVCLLPIAVVFFYYRLLGLSFDDFIAFGTPRHRGIVYLVSAALFCFHWGWIFFFKGWKSGGEYKSYYLLYLGCFLVPYLFFVHNPRLFFLSYPAIIPLITQGIKERYLKSTYQPRKFYSVIGAYILTSNILTMVHLYVMRYLKIRDWEGLFKFFS